MTPDMFELLAKIDQTHWWFVARRAILRQVLSAALPMHPDCLILDVGCGTGANIAALSSADGVRGIGIDISAEAIQFAATRFPHVQYICGQAPDDVGDLIRDVDACLLTDVLEHVENDRALLARWIDALSAGALVLITVPADMRLWSRHDEQLGHYRRYDPAMFRAMWSGLPVQAMIVTHFCARLYPLARLRGLLQRLRPGRFTDDAWNMPVPIAPLNAMLRRIFAGEATRLVDLVRSGSNHGYSRGVSLMALLRLTAHHAGVGRQTHADT